LNPWLSSKRLSCVADIALPFIAPSRYEIAMKDSPGAIWFQYQGNPYRFGNTEEAQSFLDTVQYRSEIEWLQAPRLFRLLNDVGAPLTNWREIIDAVDADFQREVAAEEAVFRHPESFERRGALLGVFKSVMAFVENQLSGEDREKFCAAREQTYKLFLTQESVVKGSICVETMYQATTREIAAGRMSPDFSTRRIAEQGMAEPHFTRDELLLGAAGNSSSAVEPETTLEPHGIWQRAVRSLKRRFSNDEQREKERRRSLGYD
jgi:hypothetical protein